jgi:hypothetical protein
MARQSGYESQESGWRDLIWAGGAAALVSLVLVAGVALTWLVGGGPSSAPALTSSSPKTPTPRAISFMHAIQPPTAPAEEPAPASASDVAGPSAAELSATAAPQRSNSAAAGDTARTPGGATFAAATSKEFEKLASGSWTVSHDALTNDGNDAVAERWLTLTPTAGPNFAVEAEIRVNSVLTSVCDQSFGIGGGSPAAGLVFGGGVIFPCSGAAPNARITNIAQWEDGYNADPVIAEKALTPGDDWHTYRFELRDGQVRLLVDGVGIVSGRADPGIDPEAKDVEAGLWSQGVGLEIRRVAVYTLPG